jgi:hypothetical protein
MASLKKEQREEKASFKNGEMANGQNKKLILGQVVETTTW